MDRVWRLTLVIIGLALGTGALWLVVQPNGANAPESADSEDEIKADTRQIHAEEIEGAGSVYHFTVTIPNTWQAESVAGSQAINLYDPEATGDTNLDKSQVFIRTFRASDFLTLQTVLIHSREALEVDAHPATRYDIEKRPNVPNFPDQPSWRNLRHTVTDVRTSSDDPAIFYVIAQRPDLPDTVYQQLLATIDVDDAAMATVPAEPVAEFHDRVTKKFFGTHVTPADSPVQPERFRGYHTGVDVEYGDIEEDVPVYAIADGTIELTKVADGYGGIAVAKYTIRGTDYHVIYGHLDPAALPKLGAPVTRGEVIGRLGDGGTHETDGERRHLHFGIYTGSSPVITGYVSKESQLSSWLDPLTFY